MDNQNIQGKERRDLPKLFLHDYAVKFLFLWFFPRSVKPNHLTIARFLATPFVFWLLYVENYGLGIPVFLAAAFTDVLDGTMARARNQITAWGTFYDPVADKILMSSVLILLIFRHLNIYLAVAIVALEILHLAGGAVVRGRGVALRALFWGKAKMVAQVTGAGLLLLHLESGSRLLYYSAEAVLAMAVFFSVLNLFLHGIYDFFMDKTDKEWGI